MWVFGATYFCAKCGSYGTDQVKGLAKECPPKGPDEWGRRALKELVKGKGPTSKKVASTPFPVL
eukprot:6348642-Pyramimonas_sp.AAC.1